MLTKKKTISFYPWIYAVIKKPASLAEKENDKEPAQDIAYGS